MISRRGFFGSIFGLSLPNKPEKVNQIVADGVTIKTSFELETIFGGGITPYEPPPLLDVEIIIDFNNTKSGQDCQCIMKCKEVQKLWKIK